MVLVVLCLVGVEVVQQFIFLLPSIKKPRNYSCKLHIPRYELSIIHTCIKEPPQLGSAVANGHMGNLCELETAVAYYRTGKLLAHARERYNVVQLVDGRYAAGDLDAYRPVSLNT